VIFASEQEQGRFPMEKELEILREVFESGRFNYLNGEYGRRFEKEFSEYFHSEYAVSCNSGTNALVLALQGLSLPHGSEVLTTPMTFVSTVHAIILAGLVPVVDVDGKVSYFLPDHCSSNQRENIRYLACHIFIMHVIWTR
jgi:dTDP-4-amino-4,6-dideoxygalactose transaminase